MEPHSHGAAPGASTWSRTRCPQGPSWYLLEQKSDTTNPERHFLQEGGTELDLAALPGSTGSSGRTQPPLTCLARAPGGSHCSARPRGEAAAAPGSPPLPGMLGCCKTRGDRAAGVGENRHWCLSTSGAWIPWEKGTGMVKWGCDSPGGPGHSPGAGTGAAEGGDSVPCHAEVWAGGSGRTQGGPCCCDIRDLCSKPQSLNFQTWKMPGLPQSGFLQWLKHQNPS